MRQVVLLLSAAGCQLTGVAEFGLCDMMGVLMKGSPPATPAVQEHAGTVWAALWLQHGRRL